MYVFGGKPVLGDFVSEHAEACLFDGQPGERLEMGLRAGGDSVDNPIDLGLGEFREDGCRALGALCEGASLFRHGL